MKVTQKSHSGSRGLNKSLFRERSSVSGRGVPSYSARASKEISSREVEFSSEKSELDSASLIDSSKSICLVVGATGSAVVRDAVKNAILI